MPKLHCNQGKPMESVDHIFTIETINELLPTQKKEALMALEAGKVLFLPKYYFQSLDEKELLSESILDGKHKNISFDYLNNRLGGYHGRDEKQAQTLCQFMQGYALFCKTLITELLSDYSPFLRWGRTSYRPAEIKGRCSSKRHDDTRLHIDSFAATPVYGQRILRIFCNINPYGEARVWHLGQPFSKVLEDFKTKIPPYSLFKAKVLHWIKATKSLRSAYDHYQLKLHDSMKLNDAYQAQVKKARFEFPAFSTWLTFTDSVSHAALSGQFLLEQTFYLPIDAMKNPELSPLKCWEREKVLT